MKPYELAGESIAPGERKTVEIPVGSLSSHQPVFIRAEVLHGKKPGPTVFVCACLHGDETNSAEIARRLLNSKALKRLRGTLIVTPILNMPAFGNRSRYLPDRRDLNRLFPGSKNGSLGSRLAYQVCQTILTQVDLVIDLHTGAVNRPNLPQVRITSGDTRARELGEVFGAPVLIESQLREQSLRSVCFEKQIPILVFEGGEALRMDTASIRFGERGIMAVLREVGCLSKSAYKLKNGPKPLVAKRSTWERAPKGGLFTPLAALGAVINVGDKLGFVADPYTGVEYPVISDIEGIVIGRTTEGIADEGDAVYHIAVTSDILLAEGRLQQDTAFMNRLTEDEDDHPVPYHPFQDSPHSSDEN